MHEHEIHNMGLGRVSYHQLSHFHVQVGHFAEKVKAKILAEITDVSPKKDAIPPKIARGPANTTSYLNERVELSCKVLGTPPPKVRWESRDFGELSKVAQNYRVHKNGSIIFRAVTKRDESKYRCIATNEAGKDVSKWAKLTVDGTPC